MAARAWGRIGDGCLLISRDQPGYLSHAEDAYRKSLALAEVAPVEVQSQSHLGLAYTLERSAAGVDAEARLNSAADHAMAVFYGRHLEAGQKVGAYWQTQSGFVAIRILERLKRYQEASLCDELPDCIWIEKWFVCQTQTVRGIAGVNEALPRGGNPLT